VSERQANSPTLRALLPSRLVPEDMLSEWQGPNLPNTKNYAPPPDSLRGRMGDVLMQGIAALGGFTGLPMSDDGDRAALLGELLAAGMPLVGGIKALRGIKAFHGSPHDFDQFSLSKIGTGEGAQAYGHGLYFADEEQVARGYRDALSARNLPVGMPFDMMERRMKANPGRMYEVNIDADPEDFLDWDAPALSTAQQKAMRSLGVRKAEGGKDAYVAVRNKAIHSAGEHRGFKAPGIQDPNGLGDIGSRFDVDVSPSSPGGYEQVDYDRIRQALAPHRGEMTPNEWVRVNAMTSGGDYDSVASQLLKDLGIPGIKYLDGASRSAGQGTRNYVVFDDTKISIVRKFGIAAALSAGAISELEARQLQAQGYQ